MTFKSPIRSEQLKVKIHPVWVFFFGAVTKWQQLAQVAVFCARRDARVPFTYISRREPTVPVPTSAPRWVDLNAMIGRQMLQCGSKIIKTVFFFFFKACELMLSRAVLIAITYITCTRFQIDHTSAVFLCV